MCTFTVILLAALKKRDLGGGTHAKVGRLWDGKLENIHLSVFHSWEQQLTDGFVGRQMGLIGKTHAKKCALDIAAIEGCSKQQFSLINKCHCFCSIKNNQVYHLFQNTSAFCCKQSLIYQPLDGSFKTDATSLTSYIWASCLPQEASHSVSCSVVQWSVVLVGFSISGVGIQSVPELLVALVQLAGEHLIPVDESLPELGCRVAHRFLQIESEMLTRVAVIFNSSSPTGQHCGCPEENRVRTITSFLVQHKSDTLIASASFKAKTSELHPLIACCISVDAEDALLQVGVTISSTQWTTSLLFYFAFFFLFVSNCQPLTAKLKQREGQDFLWHHQVLPPFSCQRCPPHRKPRVLLKEDVLDSGATCSESAIRFFHSTIWSLLFGQCNGLKRSLSYSSEPK